jgi:hypothetical protein
MNRKQLQSLISAGVFSAALLSGAAYADEMNMDKSVAASTPTPSGDSMSIKSHKKHKKSMMKNMAKHSCAGKNDCKGQGGCKTGDGGCAGKNSCKGKGGCATDGSKMPS